MKAHVKILGVLSLLAASTFTASAGAVLLASWKHQSAANAFWGSSPPDTPDIQFEGLSWIQKMALPSGGPLMGTFVSGCADTPLFLVPFRISRFGEPEVLCGFGGDTYVHVVDLDSIEEPAIRAAIKDLIQDTTQPHQDD